MPGLESSLPLYSHSAGLYLAVAMANGLCVGGRREWKTVEYVELLLLPMFLVKTENKRRTT